MEIILWIDFFVQDKWLAHFFRFSLFFLKGHSQRARSLFKDTRSPILRGPLEDPRHVSIFSKTSQSVSPYFNQKFVSLKGLSPLTESNS